MFKKACIFLIITSSKFAFAGVSGTPNPNADIEEYVFSYQIGAKNNILWLTLTITKLFQVILLEI